MYIEPPAATEGVARHDHIVVSTLSLAAATSVQIQVMALSSVRPI